MKIILCLIVGFSITPLSCSGDIDSFLALGKEHSQVPLEEVIQETGEAAQTTVDGERLKALLTAKLKKREAELTAKKRNALALKRATFDAIKIRHLQSLQVLARKNQLKRLVDEEGNTVLHRALQVAVDLFEEKKNESEKLVPIFRFILGKLKKSMHEVQNNAKKTPRDLMQLLILPAIRFHALELLIFLSEELRLDKLLFDHKHSVLHKALEVYFERNRTKTELIEFLCIKYPDLYTQENDSGVTPKSIIENERLKVSEALVFAAVEHSNSKFLHFCNGHFDISKIRDSAGRTILHRALEVFKARGEIDSSMIDYILQNHLSLMHVKSNDGISPEDLVLALKHK